MNDEKRLLPDAVTAPAPKRGDLDDLIFQGEGWIISDR